MATLYCANCDDYTHHEANLYGSKCSLCGNPREAADPSDPERARKLEFDLGPGIDFEAEIRVHRGSASVDVRPQQDEHTVHAAVIAFVIEWALTQRKQILEEREGGTGNPPQIDAA